MSAHLTEPETDYESQTSYHSVQIMVSDLGVLDELDQLFKENSPLHQELDVIGVDPAKTAAKIFVFKLTVEHMKSSIDIFAFSLPAPK